MLFGSFTGSGTRRMPAKAACSVTPCPEPGAVTGECFSAGEVAAVVDILSFYSLLSIAGTLVTRRAHSAPFARPGRGLPLASGWSMSEQKSPKGDDGRGQPAAAVEKTVEPAPGDARLI